MYLHLIDWFLAMKVSREASDIYSQYNTGNIRVVDLWTSTSSRNEFEDDTQSLLYGSTTFKSSIPNSWSTYKKYIESVSFLYWVLTLL